MTSQSDQNQIKLMSETGISNRMIGRRLNIPEAQVGRILKKMRVKRGAPMLDRMLGTEFEVSLWRIWYERDGSFRAVAERFGMSHEAVRIKLSGRQ